jgi:hypothetical protein
MLQHVAFYQSHASEGVHKQQEKLTHEDNAFHKVMNMIVVQSVC